MYTICVADFIEENYKDKLLFYSMNHPTKYVIEYICEKIFKRLNIKNTIDYNMDVLNTEKCIIYKCMQSVVNFDINKHELKMCGATTDIASLTKRFYDVYSRTDIKSKYLDF